MVASYRQHLRAFALMPFATLARHLITRRGDERVLDDIFQAARRITPGRNIKKLTVKTRGRFRFHDRKPDLEHVPSRTATEVVHALQGYAVTLNASRRRTFERYRPADVAFKLVGTGSVGTRDYVVLLFGNDANDPLFMQVKQELPSCYASVLPAPRPRVVHQGRRVAEGQQMMQTASDPFLGYTRCGGHDYLVRQLADHQAGLGPTELKGGALLACGRLCGEVLAKGHARTTDAAALAGYVGGSAKLDTAIAAFAFAYTEQTKRDFRLFVRSPNYSSADYNGFRVNPGADVSFQWTSPPWTVLADYRGLLRGGGDGGEGGGTGRGGGGATGRGGDPSLEVRRFATLAEYSQATHQDQLSVKVDYDVFVNVTRLDARDLRNVQKLYKAEDFDFSLKPGAAAVDRGVALANVTDGFTGEAPDLGALEVGQAPPHYGPRR